MRRKVPDFQPSNIVWSMFPAADFGDRKKVSKGDRRARQAETALADLDGWLERIGAAAVREALEPTA
ncbi:MAG: hypothetical protein H5U40_08465 [Polyangiaceae bacterium]|nr:hypothetical protein [Polyangiaceae bacterium]